MMFFLNPILWLFVASVCLALIAVVFFGRNMNNVALYALKAVETLPENLPEDRIIAVIIGKVLVDWIGGFAPVIICATLSFISFVWCLVLTFT